MQWERERAMWEDNIRIEELESDDTDTQGVGLNSGQRRFASDPLKFTGMDMAPASRARRSYGFEGDESSSDTSGSEEGASSAVQIALRDKEEALVQAALARIRRAREKGKVDVKLSQDELDALENRRKRLEAAAKKKKEIKGSESGSDKKRRSERKNLVTVPLSAVDPSSRKKSSRSKRSSSDLQSQPGSSNPPGILIPGPDGNLVYAPIGYPVPSASSNRSSPSRPRSATSQQILGQPPPFYPGITSRHFSDGNRPGSSSSSSSRRPLPDEEGWIPGSSRRSSVSSQNFPVDPFEYQTSSGRPPQIPEQYLLQNRRNLSNPGDISYSSLRHGYPGPTSAPASDPSIRHRSSYRDELANSSTEDESDDLGNGVQVFVEEPETGRAVSRKPVAGTGRKKGRGR